MCNIYSPLSCSSNASFRRVCYCGSRSISVSVTRFSSLCWPSLSRRPEFHVNGVFFFHFFLIRVCCRRTAVAAIAGVFSLLFYSYTFRSGFPFRRLIKLCVSDVYVRRCALYISHNGDRNGV